MTAPVRNPANPYAAPEANLATAPMLPGFAGGTLEQTLAGATNWTIGDILGDSWKLVPGFKGTAWLALIAYSVAAIVVGIAVQLVATATRSMAITQLVNYGLSALFLGPMFAGVMMLGVRRAAGEETRAAMVGDCLSQVARIAGLSILQAVLVMLGFLLLVIPGIYLGVSYILALPLLVDRRMGIWQALETSRRAIGTCWFKTCGLLLSFSALSLVGLFTLGIGLIWILPLCIIAWGMLYHRLVGYSGGPA